VHTLRELCTIAYNHVGKNWLDHVVTDPLFLRPLETVQTIADPSTAREILGWRPTVCFEDMVKKMVNAQIKHLTT
jgi:GDPmannose 4,6-dehydratase